MTDKAQQNGWLMLVPGEVYMKTLARFPQSRELFLMREADGWTLAWYTWGDQSEKPKSSKALATGKSFDEALKRGDSYVEWWEKREQKPQRGRGRK